MLSTYHLLIEDSEEGSFGGSFKEPGSIIQQLDTVETVKDPFKEPGPCEKQQKITTHKK